MISKVLTAGLSNEPPVASFTVMWPQFDPYSGVAMPELSGILCVFFCMIIILVTLHLKKKTNIFSGLPEDIKEQKVQREATAEISCAAWTNPQLVDSNKVVAHSDTVNRLQQVSIEKIRMSVSFTCVLELNCYYVVVFSANLHSYADLEEFMYNNDDNYAN